MRKGGAATPETGMTTLRICFVGDSITNGTLDDDMLGWPGRLCAGERAAGHDLTCYNLGIRADTSSDIRHRWRAECNARLPDHVPGALVFAFGVNDMADQEGLGLRVPQEESLANARAILEEAKDWLPTLWIGPAPAEMSMQPLRIADAVVFDFRNDRTADLNRAYAELAAELEIPYLDLFTPLSAADRWAAALTAGDGVHPVSDGYALMTELISDWSAWRGWMAAG